MARKQRGERQRKIAADVVDARHQHSRHAVFAADARDQPKPPQRRLQVSGKPIIAEYLLAPLDASLQPGVPRIDEAAGQPSANKVALLRHLAVKAGGRLQVGRRQKVSGHRNALSSRIVNGFRTFPTRTSNDALLPPPVNLTVKLSVSAVMRT